MSGQYQQIGYFIIDRQLPSMNDVIAKNRANKFIGAKFKREIQDDIGLYIMAASGKKTVTPINDYPIEVLIKWHEKAKRRDADNIQSSQKFILDALQENNIIVGDSRRYVEQVHHTIIDDITDFVEVILLRKQEN